MEEPNKQIEFSTQKRKTYLASEAASAKPSLMGVSTESFNEQKYEVENWGKIEKLSDSELWKSFKEGNESAFIYIYNSHFSDLYGYGFQFTQDKETIKDCIQDLFVELNKSRKGLADTNCIRAYLFKSFRNNLLHYLKKQTKIQLEDELHFRNSFLISIAQEDVLINRQLDEEMHEKLKRATMELTKRQREVIYYLYYEGLSIDQIKDIMDLGTRKSVQNILYKAIAQLKSRLTTILIFVSFLFV